MRYSTILTSNDLKRLYERAINTDPIPAKTTKGISKSRVTDKVYLTMEGFWDITEKLNSCINDCNVCQIELLIYNKGSYFTKHKDIAKGNNERIWSSTTLIYESPDLKGGVLKINDEDIKLNIGQTIFFPSTEYHEVTKIEEGTRISLVAWFNKLFKSPKY